MEALQTAVDLKSNGTIYITLFFHMSTSCSIWLVLDLVVLSM